MTRNHDSHAQGDGRQTTRRGLLRTTGVALAGLAGVSHAGTAAAGNFGGDNGDYTAPDDYPLVSTRGQFDDDGDLKAGYSRTAYDVEGNWSNYRADGDTEIVIFVHGWNIDEPGGRDAAYTCEVALEQNDYDQFHVGFTWDSDKGGGLDNGWNEGKEIARKNGPKLAQWIADHNDDGGLPVRIVAHSLGARVTAEALEELRGWDRENAVESATLLGGAIDDQEVETDEPYGADIEYAARSFYNYYKTDDEVLDWAYSGIEFDTAVGEQGIQDFDDAPYNYAEQNVTDRVKDHNSYYEPDQGCIPQVVTEF